MAEGPTPAANTAWTDWPACSRASNRPTTIARAIGMAMSFKRSLVITPSVPSAPTISLVSSSPADDCFAREPTEPVSMI